MVAANTTETPARPAISPADVGPRRQCGRCRMIFVLDERGDVPGLADWWLCEPCRAQLTPDWKP